jgi:hypothetical protein
MFGLKDLSSLPTLKDLAGLGPPPPQEEILPFTNPKPEKENVSPGEEEANSERVGEKDEPDGETPKDLG